MGDVIPLAGSCDEPDEQLLLFRDLSNEQVATLQRYFASAPSGAWRDEEVLYLHALLLQDLERLASDNAPLEQKFELLEWVFSEKGDAPFSFENCLRVVCGYMKSFPDFGHLSADSVREALAEEIRPWLRKTLERYPEWVRAAVRSNPAWVAQMLRDKPQRLNEEIRKTAVLGDLFAEAA